jgi:predicted DNA-binding protein
VINKTTTIRIDTKTYENLKKLSEQLEQPMQKIVYEALVEYKKKILLSQTAEAFLNLKKNSDLWEDEIKERELWDNTLLDGVEE